MLTLYKLFIKNNDIYNYMIKKGLKRNINETQKIINENNEEIFFH